MLTIWVWHWPALGRVSWRLVKSQRLIFLTDLAPSCELPAADIGVEAVIVWHRKRTLLWPSPTEERSAASATRMGVSPLASKAMFYKFSMTPALMCTFFLKSSKVSPLEKQTLSDQRKTSCGQQVPCDALQKAMDCELISTNHREHTNQTVAI